MSEEKKKRVFSAVLSGTVMLLVVIVAILVYQIVGIFVRKNQIKMLDAEILSLQTQIENTKDEIESWGYDWKIEQAGREQGLHNEQDD